MPEVLLWGFQKDSLSFVDGIRRGKSIDGRFAAADIGRVDVRSACGQAGEETAERRAESTEDQRILEQLEERIRERGGDPMKLTLKVV